MTDPIAAIVDMMEQQELEATSDGAEWIRRFYDMIDRNNGYSASNRHDDTAYQQWMVLSNRSSL